MGIENVHCPKCGAGVTIAIPDDASVVGIQSRKAKLGFWDGIRGRDATGAHCHNDHPVVLIYKK